MRAREQPKGAVESEAAVLVDHFQRQKTQGVRYGGKLLTV